MKLVVDAMCAEYGGIRTYVEHLLGAWHENYPDDEVHVALRAGSTLPTPGLVRHEYAIPGPDVLGRPLVQATRMHSLTRRVRPDCFLATAPTTDVRRPVVPLAVVILDLRAELRPEQFSRSRRLLRKVSYGRSYDLAARLPVDLPTQPGRPAPTAPGHHLEAGRGDPPGRRPRARLARSAPGRPGDRVRPPHQQEPGSPCRGVGTAGS